MFHDNFFGIYWCIKLSHSREISYYLLLGILLAFYIIVGTSICVRYKWYVTPIIHYNLIVEFSKSTWKAVTAFVKKETDAPVMWLILRVPGDSSLWLTGYKIMKLDNTQKKQFFFLKLQMFEKVILSFVKC